MLDFYPAFSLIFDMTFFAAFTGSVLANFSPRNDILHFCPAFSLIFGMAVFVENYDWEQNFAFLRSISPYFSIIAVLDAVSEMLSEIAPKHFFVCTTIFTNRQQQAMTTNLQIDNNKQDDNNETKRDDGDEQ